jgi:hypothetical protein
MTCQTQWKPGGRDYCSIRLLGIVQRRATADAPQTDLDQVEQPAVQRRIEVRQITPRQERHRVQRDSYPPKTATVIVDEGAGRIGYRRRDQIAKIGSEATRARSVSQLRRRSSRRSSSLVVQWRLARFVRQFGAGFR